MNETRRRFGEALRDLVKQDIPGAKNLLPEAEYFIRCVSHDEKPNPWENNDPRSLGGFQRIPHNITIELVLVPLTEPVAPITPDYDFESTAEEIRELKGLPNLLERGTDGTS